MIYILPVILISQGMDGGGILLQRVVHNGIKNCVEVNFMLYSKFFSVSYLRIYNKQILRKELFLARLCLPISCVKYEIFLPATFRKFKSF